MDKPQAHKPIDSAEDLIFEENLREFATKIGHIVGLESNDKITAADAYIRIKDLFKMLKSSKKNLRIGKPDSDASA